VCSEFDANLVMKLVGDGWNTLFDEIEIKGYAESCDANLKCNKTHPRFFIAY